MNHIVPENPKLHVVYAQRGDALVLEYTIGNNRRLLLIDGGPTGLTHGAGVSSAPLYRHWISAVRNIWGRNNATDIALDIVVSHADEDHYGGVLELLEGQAGGTDPIDWQNASVYIPYHTFSGYTSILAAARAINLLPSRMNQTLLSGFTMRYPSGREIIRLHSGGGTIDAPGTGTVLITTYPGATKTNSSSLILQNNTDNASPQGSVFFTGDSSASRILPAMSQGVEQPPNVQGPHMAIYKIQHHGAYADSLADYQARDEPIIAERTSRECLMQMLLDCALNGKNPTLDRTYKVEHEPALKAYAKKVKECCENLLLATPGVYLSPQQYLDLLKERYWTFVWAAYQFVPTGDSEEAMTIPDPVFQTDLPIEPVDILKKSDKFLKDNWQDYYIRKNVDNPKNVSAWFSRIMKSKALDELTDAFQVGQCARFYSRFTADAYVVSGSFIGNYKHPRAAVLCGLALACQIQNRAASLYLTDPRSLYQDMLTSHWIPLLNTINKARLQDPTYSETNAFYFTEDYLKVYCIDNGLYMSLNATADNTGWANPRQRWDRLISGNSAIALAFDPNAEQRAEDYRKRVEHNFGLFKNVSLGLKRYRIRAIRIVPGTQGKVNLNHVGFLANDPLVVVASALNNPLVPTYRIIESAYMFNGDIFVRLRLTEAGSDDIEPKDVLARWVNDPKAQGLWELIAVNGNGTHDMFVFDGGANLNVVTRRTHDAAVSQDLARLCTFKFEVVAEVAPVFGGGGAAAEVKEEDDEELATALGLFEDEEDTLDGSQTAVTTTTSNNITAISAEDHSISLRNYLDYLHFQPETITTRKAAIDAMLGKARNLTNDLKMGYDKLLLAALVDLDSSTVEPGAEPGDDILSANLRALKEPDEDIGFGEDRSKIANTQVLLSRLDAYNMKVKLSIITESSITLEASKERRMEAQIPTLRRYLAQLNFSAEEISTLTLADILQLIMGITSDEQSTDFFAQVWASLPDVFHDHGMLRLVPQVDDSPVKTSLMPSDSGIMVKDATIYAQMDSTVFPSSLEMAGIKFEVENVAFRIKDMYYPTQFMALTGSVKIASADDTSRQGLRLSMTSTLGEELPEISFEVSTLSATTLTSLSQLESSVQGFKLSNVEKLHVPVLQPQRGGGSGPDDDTSDKLGALPPGSSVGFSIRERMSQDARYELSSVFLSIDSEDWKSFLPESLKTPDKGVSIKTRIAVLRPTGPDPAVQAKVEFRIAVDEDRGLKFAFAAEPLGYDEYDYRMAINCVGGLTLDDVATALGFGILDSQLISSLPLIADVISKVGVEHFDAAVDSATRSLNDWSVDLILREPMDLIAERFILNNAAVNIRRMAGKSLRSSGSAGLYIHSLAKQVQVKYQTPQFGSPGFFTANIDNGLSANEILGAFGVDGLDRLPVIGTFLTAKLTFFEACFGYKPIPPENPDASEPRSDYEKSLTIFGAAVEFYWDKTFTLGPFSFARVAVSTFFHGKHHPYALGGHERKGFKITSNIFNNTTRIEAIYETEDECSIITAALRPFRPVLVRQLLESTLPENLQLDLCASVRDITLNLAAVGIYIQKKEDGTSDSGLDRFDVQLGTTSSLPMQGSRSQDNGFKLVDLMVSYRRGKPVDPGSAAAEEGRSALVLTDEDKKNAKKSAFNQLIKAVASNTKDGPIDSWSTTENYPESNSLIVTGTAGLNGKRARLAFGYQEAGEGNEDTGVVALSVAAMDKGALALENILSLLGFAEKPAYDNPDEKISFWNLEILRLGGSVHIVTPPQPPAEEPNPSPSQRHKYVLATADLAVETGDAPLELLSQPRIMVEKLGLDVTYDAQKAADAKSGLEATFYASITIAGHPLRIVCRKDAEYGFVFLGYLAFNEKSDVQLSALTSQFLDPSANFKMPDELKGGLPAITMGHVSFVFIHHKLVQIYGIGLNLWTFDIAETGLKFHVDKLGAFIRAEKKAVVTLPPAEDPHPETGTEENEYEYKVQLAGQFSIDGYDRFTVATAVVNITPADDKVLTVTLVTKADRKADVAGLASRLVLDDGSQWSKLSSCTSELAFDAAAKLYINFTESRFVLAGIIKDIGSAVLMSKKLGTEKRGWFFSMALTNIMALFPSSRDLKDMVADSFTISRLAVQVLSYDTTPAGLFQDVSTAIVGAKAKNEKLDTMQIKEETPGDLWLNPDPKAEVPPDAVTRLEGLDESLAIPDITGVLDETKTPPPIKAGTWFFAEITLGPASDYEMSSALALAAHPATAHAAKVLLYAQIQSDGASSLYGVDVRQLKLLGGALEIVHASGTYARDATTQAKQIDVRGTLSLYLRERVDFEVRYYSRKGRTEFRVAADWDSAATAIDRPFNDMFNVRLVGLGIDGIITEGAQDAEYKVWGAVKLGPDAEPDGLLVGTIGFRGSKPTAAFVTYKTEAQAASLDSMAVSDVYNKLLDTGDKAVTQPKYPEDCPAFSFTSATIGYVDGEQPFEFEHRIYASGFTLQAQIYVFDAPFLVRANLGTAKQNHGIRFTATYEGTVELDFADIVGYLEDGENKIRNSGPEVELDARAESKKIMVRAGVSFFKTEPVNLELGYHFTDRYFFGDVALGNFLGVRGSNVGFVYKDGRFSFEGFKIIDGLEKTKGMSDALDIHELLKKGGEKNNSTCGALIDFVFDKVIATKFIVNLSLPRGGNGATATPAIPNDAKSKGAIGGQYGSLVDKDGEIHLDIDWGYQVALKVPLADEYLPRVPLAEVEKIGTVGFSFSPKIDKDQLLLSLGEKLITCAAEIAESIVSDPVQLSAIAAIIVFESLGRDALKAILCRNAEGKGLGEKILELVTTEALEGAAAAGAAIAAAVAAVGPEALAAGAGIILGLLLLGFAALALAIAIFKTLQWLRDKVSTWSKTLNQALLDAIEAALKKVGDMVATARRDLTKQLGKIERDISFPDKAPRVTWHSDDPADVWVHCDWADELPAAARDGEGKLIPGTEWRVLWCRNGNFDDVNDVVETTSKVPSVDLRSPGLAYCRSIHVRVKTMIPVGYERMKLDDTLKVPDDRRIRNEYETQLGDVKSDVFGNREFVEAASWSAVGSRDHIPYLRPPTGVAYGPALDDPSQGLVGISGVFAPLRIRIAGSATDTLSLFDEEQRPAGLSETFSPLATPVSVPVRLLAPKEYPGRESVGSTRAFVKHLTRTAEFRDSPWAESIVSVPTIDRVTNLDAKMQDLQIRATWTNNSNNSPLRPSPAMPFINLIQNGTWYDLKAKEIQPPSTTTPTERIALLTAPDVITHADEVKIAVCDTDIPAGSIAIFTAFSVTIDYLPVITIDGAGSYLDLNTKALYLSLRTSFEKLPDTSVTAVFKPTSRLKKKGEKTGSYMTGTKGQTAFFVVANVNTPILADLSIRLVDKKSEKDKIGSSWRLAVPQSTLPRPSLSARISSDDSLVVSWIRIANIPTVHIRISDSNSNSVGKSATQQDLHCEFQPGELPVPATPGQRYTISAYAVRGQARGAWSSALAFEVPPRPQPDPRWSGPLDTGLGKISTNSSIGLLSPTAAADPATKLSAAIWSTSGGTVTYDHQQPGEERMEIEDPATALPTGSALASVCLSDAQQEIYWIGADGSIQARRRQLDPSDESTKRRWTKIDGWPFAAPETARTEGGGSITAVAHPDGRRIDLWWMDHQNALVKAVYTRTDGDEGVDEMWTDASCLVPGEMMGSTSSSSSSSSMSSVKLISCGGVTAGSESHTDMLWLTPGSGRMHGERANGGDGDGTLGHIYAIRDEGVDAVSAAPTSAPALLSLAGKSTRVWWITADGSVQTAVQLHNNPATTAEGGQGGAGAGAGAGVGAGGGSLWRISMVAGYQSASVYSELAATYIDGGGNGGEGDLRVFWVSPEGRLICARAASTTEPKTEWLVTDSLPDVSVCKAIGEEGGGDDAPKFLRKWLVATALGSKKIGLWYASADGSVKSLIWAEGE
ncbi:hypothetical protein F5X97DRAFT_327879 [Nemania serpens]|nr:hypothetical protein F5X97DRAFT_327879 [Nemania serpens]